jgi:hypothetical protein
MLMRLVGMEQSPIAGTSITTTAKRGASATASGFHICAVSA